MTAIRRSLLLATLVSLQTGCAYFATSHLPYTPLLHRGGQADVSIRTGFAYPGGVPIAVNAAVAIVDGLEIVASGDVNVGSSATHYGGGIGIGTFVPTDVFRLELIGGVNAGYATGVALGSSSDEYSLSGAYLQPFGQLMLGFELERFIFAGGVRIQGFLADTTAVPTDGSSSTLFSGYNRGYAEPILTAQFPFDLVRVEITASMPILFDGDVSPIGGSAVDAPIQFYFGAGVGFQWDAFGEGEPEPEPVDSYTPIYATPEPAPAPAEPIVLPTAPPDYETPSEPEATPEPDPSETAPNPSETEPNPSETEPNPSEPDPSSPFRSVDP